MDRPVLPVFPAPTDARAEATRRVPMRNISPSLSRHYREKNFVAGTWMHCTLLSLEKPPRLVPCRTCAWQTWLSALDWRTSSEHSTMPGTKGVITITGNRKKAEECFQKGSKIADAHMIAEEWQEH